MAEATQREKIDDLLRAAKELLRNGNNDDKALEDFQHVRLLAQEGDFADSPYFEAIAQTLRMEAIYFERRSNYLMVVQRAKEALHLCHRHHLDSVAVWVYSQLCIAYYHLGDFDQAYMLGLGQLTLAELINDLSAQGAAENTLAMVTAKVGKTEEARAHYARALKIFQQNSDDLMRASVLNNMCVFEREAGDLSRALAVGLEGLILSSKLKDTYHNALFLGNVGDVYAASRAYDKARTCFRERLDIAQQNKYHKLELYALRGLSRVCLSVGEFQNAINYAQTALDMASEYEDRAMIVECHDLLSRGFEAQKRNVDALHHVRESHRVQEELFRQEMLVKIENIEAVHLLEKAERRIAVEQERRAQETLHYEGALKDREELLRVVTHDLKTPLTSLLLSLDQLKERTPKGDSRSELLVGRIGDAAKRIQDLCLEILDMRVLNLSLNNTPALELSQLICTVVDGVTSQIEAKQLALTLDLVAAHVSVDPVAIRHVLENLLSNAIKYNHEAGKLIVRLELQGAEVQIMIEDSGIGIAPEDLMQLFNPYFRASNALPHDGTGLGLSLVKSIIERQGGRIWVESVLGEGTRFYFALPLAG
jgi:signal transduction histidine kinase